MALEGVAIYCAILCVCLTGALSFNISDESIDKMLMKILNVTYIIFGPLLFTGCLYGFKNFKAISRLCDIRIYHDQVNFAGVVMLLIFFCISIAVSIAMIIDKTSEMNDIQNGDNIFYTMGQLYFRYHQKLREGRNRNRRRERQMKRNEKASERREIEEFKRSERVLLEKRD